MQRAAACFQTEGDVEGNFYKELISVTATDLLKTLIDSQLSGGEEQKQSVHLIFHHFAWIKWHAEYKGCAIVSK